MADLRNMIVTFILTGLFALCLLAFLYQSSKDNNPSSSLLTEPIMNSTYKSLNSSLNDYQSLAEQQKNLSFSENPLSATFGLVSFAIVGAGRVFSNMIIQTWNILTIFMFNTIGIPPIVIGIIFTIILISIIFYSWKLWRQGS